MPNPWAAAMDGVTLRSTAWVSQQKSRVQTMRLSRDSDKQYETMLEVYREVRHALKTRIIERKAPAKEGKRGTAHTGVPPVVVLAALHDSVLLTLHRIGSAPQRSPRQLQTTLDTAAN